MQIIDFQSLKIQCGSHPGLSVCGEIPRIVLAIKVVAIWVRMTLSAK